MKIFKITKRQSAPNCTIFSVSTCKTEVCALGALLGAGPRAQWFHISTYEIRVWELGAPEAPAGVCNIGLLHICDNTSDRKAIIPLAANRLDRGRGDPWLFRQHFIHSPRSLHGIIQTL